MQNSLVRSRWIWLLALAAAAIGIAAYVAVLMSTKADAAARVVNLTEANRVARLAVVMGTSETIRISLPFSEIVVGDPETADVNPLTDRTLYVLGRKLGMTNVALFDQNKQLVGVIDVEITHNLTGLRQALRQSVPGGSIKVRSVNGRVLLEGMVPSAPAAEKAVTLAREFTGDQVSNSLTIADNQQVNLEVRFVEINRTAGKELGINWNLTDNNFGGATGSAIHISGDPPRGSIGSPLPGLGIGALSSALPFGTFVANILSNGVAPDLLITALEQKKLARRLAEPNLTTLSGQSASFLAGGEFPVPIAQDNNEVTVEFKQFGVRLDFTPIVLDDGLINLQIQPEVSEIDQAASIRLREGGILIPGLSVRRANTTVELRDGQSFAIAGLLQSVNAKTADQVPWLGDVPVLGTLFRSQSFQKKESDLVIIVTPRLQRPVGTRQQLVTPFDGVLSSNEPEFFLLGKQEVSRAQLNKKYGGKYGHIIDLQPVDYGTPNK